MLLSSKKQRAHRLRTSRRQQITPFLTLECGVSMHRKPTSLMTVNTPPRGAALATWSAVACPTQTPCTNQNPQSSEAQKHLLWKTTHKNSFAATHGISIPRPWKHLSRVVTAAAATATIVLPAPLLASGREGVEDVQALEFRHQNIGTLVAARKGAQNGATIKK